MKSTFIPLFFAAAVLLMLPPGARSQTVPVLTTLYSFTNTTADGAFPNVTLAQGSDGNFYGTTNGSTNSDGSIHVNGTIFSITPAGGFTLLHNFTDTNKDGSQPVGLVQGSDGNFYGVTTRDGTANLGTVYSITPAGVLTTLHSFTGTGTDGEVPQSALVLGNDGSFHGTTNSGGSGGSGTVFSITPAGVLTTQYNFSDTDGSNPEGLIQGSDGNLYGVTLSGGASEDGTVFSLTPTGVLTTLHSFSGTDGSFPAAALVQGSDGNFYGTAEGDGSTSYGTVFSVTPAGVFTTLHNFSTPDTNGFNSDGTFPQSKLVQGSDGNFYGTAANGGATGNGTIFSITPAGFFTNLHNFSAADSNGLNSDGSIPQAGLTLGSDGNFYGVTAFGGTTGGTGTFFRLSLVSPGMLQFASPIDNTTENVGSVTLTVNRVGGSAGAVSVNYATSDGTATAGADYAVTAGTLSWADGDTADKTFTVPILDRGIFDGSTKTFSVVLNAATGGATLGTTISTTVNILDDDTAPQPTVVIASPPDGSTFVSGATVPFAASVFDPGGILTAVQFTVNGIQVAKEHGEGPFVSGVTAPPIPGDYVVVANATDSQGRTSSSTVTVHVLAASAGSNPPTSALLTPVDGRSLAAGSTVTLDVAAAADSATALVQVTLYADGLPIAAFDGSGNPLGSTAGGRPTRRDVAAGITGILFQTSYTMPGTDRFVNLIAVALDKLGHNTVSTVASIHSTVTSHAGPTVALGGITSGTHFKVNSSTPVSVSASAADTLAVRHPAGPTRADAADNGGLALLEYYLNGIKLTQAAQPPYSFTFTPPSAGKYVLAAVATDSSGLATVSEPVVVVADALPTVSVAAGGTGLVAEGGAKGVVLITRTGDTSAPLTVSYKIKGSALAGVDYKPLAGTVVFPAGLAKVKVKLKPLDDETFTGTRVAKFKLLPPADGSYVLGTLAVAKLKFVDGN